MTKQICTHSFIIVSGLLLAVQTMRVLQPVTTKAAGADPSLSALQIFSVTDMHLPLSMGGCFVQGSELPVGACS